MTTEEYDAGHKLERMQANLAKIEGLYERLMAALARQKQKDAALDGPSSDIYMKAAQAYLAAMLQNPRQGAGASDRLLGQNPDALCRGPAGAGLG